MDRAERFRGLARLFVPFAVAAFAVSAMVVDELFMTAAYGDDGFRTCYHVPFLGCWAIWDVWKVVFIVMLGIVLALSYMVLAFSNA